MEEAFLPDHNLLMNAAVTVLAGQVRVLEHDAISSYFILIISWTCVDTCSDQFLLLLWVMDGASSKAAVVGERIAITHQVLQNNHCYYHFCCSSKI